MSPDTLCLSLPFSLSGYGHGCRCVCVCVCAHSLSLSCLSRLPSSTWRRHHLTATANTTATPPGPLPCFSSHPKWGRITPNRESFPLRFRLPCLSPPPLAQVILHLFGARRCGNRGGEAKTRERGKRCECVGGA
ncbi:hypothetical protein LZ32DRAFT_46210 [Colletotrichum eremochloae]|nr:hypothetical protein LZ32DRAFT_46210 [Colletotrichum eremochloae]